MPYEFVTEKGLIEEDTSEVRAGVEDEYKSTLGADLNVSPETPEGVLISAETASRVGIATNNAQLANQINPTVAGGTFLDAIMALTGGKRSGASRSTIASVTVTGVVGTLIEGGSRAANDAGDEFETTGDVTLPVGGVDVVNFIAVETGAIAAPIGTLTTIITGVPGWETVTNPTAAVLGGDVQNDISARRERLETLGRLGSSSVVAISSNVRAVEGVKSLSIRENITAAPIVIDNVNLVANSIWVCVDGGTDSDIAFALLESKSIGSAWNNGNSSLPVTENIVDPTSGQAYDVEFDRPDLVPVLYEVTITSSSISNSVDIVKKAVVAYAEGELDQQKGLVVGADVSPYEASGAVNIVEPGLTVTNVRVTTVAAASFQTATIAIELFQKATVDEAAVTVIVA